MPDQLAVYPTLEDATAILLDAVERAGYLKPPIDLHALRELLPYTPFGRGDVLLPPAPFESCGMEGALLRNPNEPREWGILYNPNVRLERQRFTISHEIGHFVLHRAVRSEFHCGPEVIHSSQESLEQIEYQADQFASAVLMPKRLIKPRLDEAHIDLHLLSELAHEFQVSLYAMCLRFVRFTRQRAILAVWDNGYLRHVCFSGAAKQRLKLHPVAEHQSPWPKTLAAMNRIKQDWKGREIPVRAWFPNEPLNVRLREMKYSFANEKQIISLLVLDPAPKLDRTVNDAMERFLRSQGEAPLGWGPAEL